MKEKSFDNLDEEISFESSKEQVAEFFCKEFKFKDSIKENLIKEDISGDILLDLNDIDLKYLGLKKSQIKKVKEYLLANKDKFYKNNIDVKINQSSTEEEVNNFFKQYIGFNSKVTNINGKALLNFSSDNISNIGLNIGQTKKLEKYLKQFKSENKKNKKTGLKKSKTEIESKFNDNIKKEIIPLVFLNS
jgi:hypothetical protein